ncbi:MAG TPA: alcohol dehydrogenase catalytic domain-containing protein [Gaiellaceae bacterium]|nr:alcohol dehydrogenase catalytic domain-containing protein [Gaiellaceae bacterium]
MSAVYYEGAGAFSVGECVVEAPGPGEVRLDVAYCGVCGTDLHIAHGAMDGRVRAPQVIGHEMSGTVAEVGAGVEGFAAGDPVVVRPLDSRGETPADRGFSHISRNLRFLGIDAPGALQVSWTVPAFTLHALPPMLELRLGALAEPLAVACHDVRRGAVAPGDTVVVIGGGPIGILIALVARARGATTLVVEPDESRRALAAGLGFAAYDPAADDVAAAVVDATAGAGADVVFEVSGSAAGILAATQYAGLRCRVVVVAIFPEPRPVALFDLFWKELELFGARVYEPEDFDAAIELLADGSFDVARLITAVEPLARVPAVFDELVSGRPAMKILVDCRA